VEKWWTDKERLIEAVEKHGNLARAARAEGGCCHQTLSVWWRRHELPPLSPGHPGVDRPPVRESGETQILNALKKLGDAASVEELADLADMSPRRVRAALDNLGRDGYRVEATSRAAKLDRFPSEQSNRVKLTPSLFDGDVFRFGVVSDTHLGSKAERPDAVDAAYDVFQQEQIQDVFHVGDLVDGLGVYKTQNTEVLLHTYEDQVDHAADVYPERGGMTTWIIGGNHDLEGDFGKAGCDPVQAVANRRSDFQYLGRYSAHVDLPNGATMHMLHPQGGGAYATSWRPQKIAESYEAGSKPNVLLIGHYHRTGYFMVRGIQTMMAGTFQGPTTFSIRKAMGEAGWGFWIVEATLADDGSVVRFKPEWLPFYAGRDA
jgi:predicted phosphodiesterase